MTRACDTLVLIATSSRKDNPRWAAAVARNLSYAEVLSARCYLDWLMLWLPLMTRETDWANEQEGRTGLLTWKIHEPGDALFALDAETPGGPASIAADQAPTATELSALRKRLAWRYRHEAAAREPAKTSVTRLRRRLRDETADEAGSWFANSDLKARVRSEAETGMDGVTAAERGIAHHTFLQMISLARVGSPRELQEEAERLRSEAVLSAEEIKSLDLGAITAFWKSDVGKQILHRRNSVHREIPFTARFTAEDLAALELLPDAADLDGEFFVVQGYIDLAVILPEEIWPVDFKTDAVSGPELDAKSADYGRQLKLYGLALQRIYHRPVAALWLHFLMLRKTIPVEAAPDCHPFPNRDLG